MAGVDGVEVVVAHRERATLRVGGVFLKVDADPARTGREVAAMALAPVPTATVLWHRPPALALAAVPGAPLGRLGDPTTAPPAAWAAAGAVLRRLHGAPLPPWPGRSVDELAMLLDTECRGLVDEGVLPADLVARARRVAEAVLRPWEPVFVHGDLQPEHVLVDGVEVTGVLDWSEAARGDALADVAVLTMGHPERLGDVLTGHGADVDLDVDRHVVRGWWAWRGLTATRWLLAHGFDPFAPGCEVDVVRAAGSREGPG